MIHITRRERFSSAHKLENKNLSHKENCDIFGACYNVHGHNYELIVSVRGMINPETGYVIDMGYLKLLIKNEIEEILDHKNLNLDVPYFSNVIPSAENICVFIYEILRSKIEDNLNLSIRLYETPRNYVEYSG